MIRLLKGVGDGVLTINYYPVDRATLTQCHCVADSGLRKPEFKLCDADPRARERAKNYPCVPCLQVDGEGRRYVRLHAEVYRTKAMNASEVTCTKAYLVVKVRGPHVHVR